MLKEWRKLSTFLNVAYINVAQCERDHGKIKHVSNGHQSMMTIEVRDDLLQIKVGI